MVLMQALSPPHVNDLGVYLALKQANVSIQRATRHTSHITLSQSHTHTHTHTQTGCQVRGAETQWEWEHRGVGVGACNVCV